MYRCFFLFRNEDWKLDYDQSFEFDQIQKNVQNQRIETTFAKFRIASNDKKIIIKIIIKNYVN
jgi:hypothetical protein